MKKLYTFWYSFQKSLLDPQYYKDIIKASYWFSFKYLFFLLTILSIVRSVQLGTEYLKVRSKIPEYIKIGKQELAALYPKELEVRISNGKLFTNVKEPYFIDFPKRFGDVGEQHLIAIDTKASPSAYKTYKSLVLATREVLVYPDKQQGESVTTKMYFFSDMKQSLYIDHSKYIKIVESINPFLVKLPSYIEIAVIVGLIIIPLFGGIFWASSTLFGLYILTIFVWIVAKLAKKNLDYNTLLRLGMHGATWAILFTFILDLTNKSTPGGFNIIFLLWMTFIVLKMKLDEPIVVTTTSQ